LPSGWHRVTCEHCQIIIRAVKDHISANAKAEWMTADRKDNNDED
jgi:hypothetical protein